jgi:hypothetical protein
MKLEEYVYWGRSFEVASDIFRDTKSKYLLIVMFVSCSGTQLSVLTPTLMKYYKHYIINVIVFVILQFCALVIYVTIGGEMDCL